MLRTATRHLAIYGLTVAAIAAGTSQTQAVPGFVKRACSNDYFTYCSKFQPGTPEVRQCFHRNGKRLSDTCVDALRAAGLTSVKRPSRRLAGR